MEALIDDEARLAELCEIVSRSRLVAVDTEFVRERTYFARLCLLQLATEERTACVDCLAGLDLGPLFTSLGGSERAWVLHSGRQDLEVIRQTAGVLPARLIDTQIAAALLGHGAQVGLQELLADVLAVELGKGFTRTDWSRRPLPDGALRYALDDVHHLLPLWRRLEERLAALGRLDWLAEDAARMLRESGEAELVVIWKRIKGVQNLGEPEQRAALALVHWRERTARALDRPRRWVMSDELITRLAQLKPGTHHGLADVAEMPKRLAARYGAEILAAIAARNESALEQARQRAARPEKADREALKALQLHVKARASALGMHPEVLASRRDLLAWLGGFAPEHLRSGWRAAALEPLPVGPGA